MSTAYQRKKKRVSMVAAAVVRQSPLHSPTEAYIINISYGGLGMYVKNPLDGRVQIAISLSVGTGKRVTETVWGHVTWKKPVGSSYAIGISFEGLNPQDHKMLLSHLENCQTRDQDAQTGMDDVTELAD